MLFYPFKTHIIQASGFYILRYREWTRVWDEPCWLEAPPKHHFRNTYSYHCTTENTRDKDTCHDFGHFMWVNNPWGSGRCGPEEWSEMTYGEAREYGKRLFMFSRPSWAHKNGKVHLP